MGKKKARMSLFSTLVQQINEPSDEYHLIDNEYFPAFNSLDDIQQFHQKITEKQQSINMNEDTDLHLEQDINEMDMKSFAQQYLVDLPEHGNLSRTPSQELFSTDQPINWSPKVKDNQSITQPPDNNKRKSTTPVKFNNKRQRRNIRDLPQSSEFIFTSDNDHQNSLNPSTNIFDCLQNERPSDKKNSSLSAELSIIKNEPTESEQLIVEAKEEPIELDVNPMGFGTSEYSGHLDDYVQNIHLLRQSSPNSQTSSRPQRIRKQKKFYIEESELIIRPKKLKTPIRKKRPSQISSTLPFTDAEIEQQFGERLPSIKFEHDDPTQSTINSRVIIEFEPVIQTPIEKARAKLTTALGRGHEPDTYLLKIRSREHKIIEVQLAIYSTTDWYSHRTKILSKIEEALRGLRVSWTKIDIHVDDFDIQISTSSETSTISPPTSVSNTNSSWFLKVLSESNPLIVHIHDRRYPQQRLLIKCSCSECSPTFLESSIDSSLPIIVNVSPGRIPTRRLNPPTILNKTPQTNISSLHNIDTTFFNDLISQWGRNIIISVTQCVLDLALIISVHTSLPSLCVSPNYSKEEYKKKYQQIIDPLKYTFNENEQIFLSNKTPMIARVVSMNSINHTQSVILSKPPDIITFYNLIKQNKANIRSAKSMRNLITRSFSSPVTSPLIKSQTLILPKPSSSLSHSNSQRDMSIIDLKNSNEQNHRIRRRDKYSRTYFDSTEIKQQAHCTPIIELKPILGGITQNKETILIQDSQNNSLTNSARVIRLSIAKSAPQTMSSNAISPSTIRLIPSPKSDSSHSILSVNKNEAVPLVPKQINIIKSLSTSSSSITPAIKLSNPVLISNKSQQPSTK